MLCLTCNEPADDGMCYDCEWFFKKVVDDVHLLCQRCRQPFSEDKTRSDCGVFIDAPEFIVQDLYNYNAKPQRACHRLDHFKEVLGQFQGREGKTIPHDILHQIKYEIRIVNEVGKDGVSSGRNIGSNNNINAAGDITTY